MLLTIVVFGSVNHRKKIQTMYISQLYTSYYQYLHKLYSNHEKILNNVNIKHEIFTQ